MGGFAAPAAPQLRALRVGLGIPRQHARVACRTAETYLGENNKQISFSCLCEAWLGARKAKMEQEARAHVFLSPLWKELIRVSEFPFAISTAGCQLIAHLLWERPAGKRHTALICPLLRCSYQFLRSSSHLHGRGMSWGALGGGLRARAAPHAWI